ncbi:MAG: tRNA pseudouridine(55) synthase TruB [Salibacteraceae bacterium]
MSKLYNFRGGEVLLVDKPLEWTSFDVVNKLRYQLKHKTGIKRFKVGHAGTLDPLASGLLIVCCGKATKTIDSFMGMAKEYTGTIVLGATRPSYDMETEIDQEFDISGITDEMVHEAVKTFIGEIQQVPPLYSAKKVDGKKAYELARKGSDLKLKPNSITIHEYEITQLELPEVDFRIKCSKGTYIRSLAHDLGTALNNGGYLKTLRRTSIGEYQVTDAKSVDDWVTEIQDAEVAPFEG